jgi:hypothetical protein
MPSKRACRLLGPARVAYENGEAGTVTEIAQMWAERTAGKPAWRQAALDGCLAGFAAGRRSRSNNDTAGLPKEERDFIACLRGGRYQGEGAACGATTGEESQGEAASGDRGADRRRASMREAKIAPSDVLGV